MSLRVVFHPKVFSEVDTIMDYYERVAGNHLANDFYAEFRLFVQDASGDPEINFLFRVQGDAIRVLVIRHHARLPTYGTKRI